VNSALAPYPRATASNPALAVAPIAIEPLKFAVDWKPMAMAAVPNAPARSPSATDPSPVALAVVPMATARSPVASEATPHSSPSSSVSSVASGPSLALQPGVSSARASPCQPATEIALAPSSRAEKIRPEFMADSPPVSSVACIRQNRLQNKQIQLRFIENSTG
tara:strand:+ start:1965 stop:2456 length:492 start_codon:yes stop_codon:yes gene_type:complete